MVDLSPTTTYFADANLFIMAGTPKRERAQALIAFFSREPWTLLVHPDVEAELTDETRKFTRHRTLQRAIDEGWARVVPLPVEPIANVERIEEAARVCIAERTNRSIEAIERTDVRLVGLAADRLERGTDTDIGLITNDRAFGACFETVLSDFGYDRAAFINARRFLDALHSWYESREH